LGVGVGHVVDMGTARTRSRVAFGRDRARGPHVGY